MILKKMTARFGRLQDQTLTLHEGLNVIHLPNEAGKSTWTEFLLAMLYGVETKDQRKKGYLPVKEKYRPWDGGEMSGSIELEQGGQSITIERSGTERAPMAQFRAYETASGLPVALDGKRCGQTLLHAERSVYERSGFIRQQQLAVTSDAALEQKLAALVTTGDETYAYSSVEQQLRDLKNRCKYHKSGLLPETEAALFSVTQQLAQVHSVQEQLALDAARQKALETERAELSHAKVVCDALDSQRKQARVASVENELHKAEADAAALAAQCATLPDTQTLDGFSKQLSDAVQEQHALLYRRSLLPQPPQPPQLPKALQEAAPEALRAKAEQDREACRRLAATPAQAGRLPLYLGCGAFALVLVLAALLLMQLVSGLLFWLPAALLLLTGAALTLLYLHQNRLAQQRAAEANAALDRLLRGYGATAPDELPEIAEKAAQDCAQYAQALAQAEAERDALNTALAQAEEKQTALLAQVNIFDEHCNTLAEAQTSIEAAQRLIEATTAAQARAKQLRTNLDDLRALTGEVVAVSAADAERYAAADPTQIAARLARCEGQLALVQSALDAGSGKLSAMGDALALEAQKQHLSARKLELEQKNAALTLALEALGEANRELQSRFSPLVCQRAAELFARLSGGRYDRVLLDNSMSVSVQEPGAAVTRVLQWLSAGTVDQLYLALRLAISELLLPDAPLVLDDALVAFDDERAKTALQVLLEESGHRQILLFTCQSRENRLLEDLR